MVVTRIPSASSRLWGWTTFIAIIGGLVGLMLVPNAFPMHGNDRYGPMLIGGLASLTGGIVAAWSAGRHRRGRASRVAKSLVSATGWAAGVMLTLFGVFFTVQATEGIRHPPFCSEQNSSVALGALRAANSGINTLLASPGKSLPRRGSPSDWDSWVPPELGAALADPNVAFRGAYQFVFTPSGTSRDGYSIVARPVKYGFHGTCSVYTDQSGVIRYTTEDRPATAQDTDVFAERWGLFPR